MKNFCITSALMGATSCVAIVTLVVGIAQSDGVWVLLAACNGCVCLILKNQLNNQ